MAEPSRAEVRRWRQSLADERAEAAVYRDLAARRDGEEREILLALAEAERRHEAHWLNLLGDEVGPARRGARRTRALGWAARRFGSVFVLALAQQAETRLANRPNGDATEAMTADEAIHAEVVRGLAARGRQQMSGSFRAAVFGANDGLVSNLALVLGIGATGVSSSTVLVTGVAGLLAGALSMGAGEYVSVSSQRELLAARRPSLGSAAALRALDAEANELALVYRAHGMDATVAAARARALLAAMARPDQAWSDNRVPEVGPDNRVPEVGPDNRVPEVGPDNRVPEVGPDGPQHDDKTHDEPDHPADQLSAALLADLPGGPLGTLDDDHEAVGTPWGAASSSFAFFASGAVVPVVPYLLGAHGLAAVVWSAGLVGLALLATGAVVGVLSGSSPVWRALRQLAIGWGAAAATYLLGSLFNATGI